MLGLESDDAAAGAALTKALRKAAAKRGLGGGPEMSLVEMRLTMGCESNTDACLAGGGKAIEVRQLIYGDLRKAGAGYKVQLFLLDVAGGSIASDTRMPLSAADLSPDKIDATAAKVIQGLLPKETDAEPTPVPVTDVAPTEVTPEVTPDEPPPPRERKYVWGREKPAPKWKKVGLGVTAGLGGGLLISGVVMQILLVTKQKDDLAKAVKDSLTDVDENGNLKTANDIVTGGKQCTLARSTTPGAAPVNGEIPVKNEKVSKVCNVADGIYIGSVVTLASGGVLAAAAVAFTVLLFVHKRKGSNAAAALLRHDLRLGAAPVLTGGVRAGVGFRF